MARRRDDRITIELPLRLWGMDATGTPFNEQLVTCDVSRTGARVRGLKVAVNCGEIFGVQHENVRSRCRVIWADAGRREIGIVCVEPGRYLWAPSHAAITRALEGRRQETMAGSGGVAAAPAAAPVVRPAPERRRHQRFPCEGGVQVRRPGAVAIWATLTDISSGGCYIEIPNPPPPMTELELTLKTRGVQFNCAAQVRTCHGGIGMGVAFTRLSIDDRKKLNSVLENLAGALPGEAPPVEAEAPPAPASPAVSLNRRINKSAEELRTIESLLQADTADVDPRIVDDFRNALDHARQTAWAVQTWMEMRKQNRDPFPLLGLVEKRRIRQTTQLMRELVMDQQSGVLSLDTEGLKDLLASIRQFKDAMER